MRFSMDGFTILLMALKGARLGRSWQNVGLKNEIEFQSKKQDILSFVTHKIETGIK